MRLNDLLILFLSLLAIQPNSIERGAIINQKGAASVGSIR
jgi:hypothetical protein